MLPTNPLLNATAPAGPHLPVATLRQYAAGTLTGAARHRVEAHTLACPRCADILEGLLQTPPATTDQALVQLQQRLHRRLRQAESARPALPRLRQRWLVPQLATAATLLFGLLAGGWYTWQQRHATPAAPVAATYSGTVPAPPSVSAPSSPPATPTAPVVPVVPAASQPAGRLASGRRSTSRLAALPAPTVTPASEPDSARNMAPAEADKPLVAATQLAAPAALPPAGRDSVAAAGALAGRSQADYMASRVSLRKAAVPGAGLMRSAPMPAAPAVPPTPVGGYPAWREKIRREATEFRPETDRTLSGTVQLRLLIGADGKIQEIQVLHGLRTDYDEEAQRLVCDGPGWIPGIGGGQRATQPVDVSVPFQ